MFKFLSPSNIFKFVDWMINSLQSVFFIILIIGLTFALIISPPDYLQSESVRIMYVHVPSAWIGLATFTCLALSYILSFIFNFKNLILITKSIAPIGLIFTCIAIVTGSIWGQPTWGTFWAWDARITSMLVLALFYVILISLHKFIDEEEKVNKISSIVASVGLINIPIIKYSVEWWSTLHQPASIKIVGTSTIHSSMLMPLLLMFFVLILYCALIFLMKYKTEIIRIKKKNLKRYDQ